MAMSVYFPAKTFGKAKAAAFGVYIPLFSLVPVTT